MKKSLALVILISSFGFVHADIPVNETAETMGYTSMTSIIADGLVTESKKVTCQGSNYALDNQLSTAKTITPWNYFKYPSGEGAWETLVCTPLGCYGAAIHDGDPTRPITQGDAYFWRFDPASNTPSEVQYLTSYSEDTIADSGQISYTQSLTIDTQNQAANQDNIKATKIVGFIGDETGLFHSEESLLLDIAGQYGWSHPLTQGPFESGTFDVIPQFCNYEEVGSSVTMKQMVMTTSTSDRFVAATADVPTSMDYEITVNGIKNSPAIGDVSAYINVHSMEGSLLPMFGGEIWGYSYRPGQAADLIINEETNVRGEIHHFQKEMSYISGIRRIS